MFFQKPDNSAQGVLALLEQEANQIKIYALRKLVQIVDYSWPEVADSLPTMQQPNFKKIIIIGRDALSSDSAFPESQLASLLASKIFYHLEQYDEALKFILESGNYFNIDAKGDDEYIHQMLSKCIDDYISKCRQNFESSESQDKLKIHPRLEEIIEELLARCFRDGNVAQAVGIAIDSRRLDKLSKAIMKSPNILETLSQCYELSLTTIKNKSFRIQVLKIIKGIYNEIQQEDFVTLAKCMFFLNESEEMAALLKRLLNNQNEKKSLIAYQIAIELYQNENQQFLQDLRNLISESDDMGDVYNDKIRKLQKLLSGQTLTNIHRLFLQQKNKSDKLLFSEHLMKNITHQNSIHHNMVNWTASIMYAGTSDPDFFTTNFEWVAKASNWAKFLATASIGSIHYLNPKVQEIVGQYLPGGAKGQSPYTNGGAFYALGIAHANRYNEEIAQKILAQIPTQSQRDAPMHGICLGLGLTALATKKMNIYDELKNLLYTDNANVGEAAAWSMGMVMAGSADQTAIQEMLTYANDTQHEKIIRAIGIGLALIMYGRQEEADALVDQLYLSQDALLRFGAMYVIGMAYAGSNNNKAIRKLLHVTVSDVDSNVRRAAITNVGFLLFKTPEKVPRMIAHLVQSYNPYVRQGTAMALGIACAGTGNKEAMILLGKLRSDFQDFVRQGAWIASGLICMQERNGVEDFDFDLFEKHLGAKSEPTLTRMGVVIALGIINAGGRNTAVRLHARSGHNRMAAIVGMAMFLQYWYWFPVLHFLTLSLTPAAMIGIDSKMRVPLDFKVKSNAKPSEFGYPKEIVKTDDKPKQIEKTAVLSAANRVSMRKKQKENKEITDGSATPSLSQAASEVEGEEKKEDAKQEDKKQEEKKEGTSKVTNKRGKKKKKKGKYNEIDENEPDFEILSNPSRVLLRQEAKIEQIPDQRYASIAKHRSAGFVMLEDLKPDTPEEEEGQYLQDSKDEAKKEEEKKGDLQADSGVPQPASAEDIEPPPEFELDDDDDDDDDDTDEKGKLLPK